jgi:hypothetical protein
MKRDRWNREIPALVVLIVVEAATVDIKNAST